MQNQNGLKMYFDREIVRRFAASEQNEVNFRTAAALDRVIMREISHLPDPLMVAELGGGAHPDRYHKLFSRLLRDPRGHIDWVDIAPLMLEQAREYLKDPRFYDRTAIISFLEQDIIEYLKNLPDAQLDLAIMKYIIPYLPDLDPVFSLLAQKLRPEGRLVATTGVMSPELKSISSNARYLYRGSEFPLNETRTLKEGEGYGIKFLKETGNVSAGYMAGGETIVYFHSKEYIETLGKKYGFKVSVGDWKEVVPKEDQEGENITVFVVVLRK